MRMQRTRRLAALGRSPLTRRPLAGLMSKKSDALAVPVDVTMRRPTLLGVPAMPTLAAPLVVRRAQVEEVVGSTPTGST